ncbi:hypothetical protein LJR225_000602 [Phenylobacterium sp. LjRoot225]|uniref:hypothetical protein n=1 Tax=Phenylobacterium sp. LjRoot225 TaxID=3342285 RepID=UPI003ECE6B6B
MSRPPVAPATRPLAGDALIYSEVLAAYEARRRAEDAVLLRKMNEVRSPQQPS